jgi:hypothetical protein
MITVPDNETTTNKRRKLTVTRVLIVLLLIVIAAFVLFRLSVRAKLQARIDAIRAAGYPATCAELNDWYTIPDSVENGAYWITDAFSYYYELTDREELKLMPIVGRAELPPRTEALSETTKNLLAQHIADNQQALELLHKGAAAEYFRYPVDFSAGLGTLMPYLNQLKKGAKLLNLEAVLYAEKGKPQLATDSVISSFGIAHSLTKEPMLVSQLVRIASETLTVSALEHIVNRTELADEQLAEITEYMYNAEDPSAMSRGYVGERCTVLSVFKKPTSLSAEILGADVPPVPVLELYKALGLADMDAVTYIDHMDGYHKTTQLPAHLRQKAADAIDANVSEVCRIRILLRIIMPALAGVTKVDLRNMAQLRTAITALAIQRCRLATSRLPDSLAELVPTYLDAVPKDPFDGNDLRYKKLETGFVVYSIGEDRSDDGGKERPPTRERGSEAVNYDVTFIIER